MVTGVRGEPVTIHRTAATGAVDRYGNPTDGPTQTITVTGCAVAPRSTSEENTDRAGVITGLTVYAPPGTRINPADRLHIRNALYEVEGEPGIWVSPFTGVEAGVEVAVRRVEG